MSLINVLLQKLVNIVKCRPGVGSIEVRHVFLAQTVTKHGACYAANSYKDNQCKQQQHITGWCVWKGPTNRVPWLVENIVIFQIRLENNTQHRLREFNRVGLYTTGWPDQNRDQKFMNERAQWEYTENWSTPNVLEMKTQQREVKKTVFVLGITSTVVHFYTVLCCTALHSLQTVTVRRVWLSRLVGHWSEHAIEQNKFFCLLV